MEEHPTTGGALSIHVVASSLDRTEVALFKGLSERGHIVSLTCHPDAPRREAIDASGLPVKYLAIRHRLDVRAARVLRCQLTPSPPHILYAPTNRTLSVSLMATRGLTRPKVIGYRGTIGHIRRIDPASWLTYLHPRLAHIVSVSEAVRQYLVHKIKLAPDHVTTIHKGHDVAWYDTPVRIDRHELGVPAGAVAVGFAGNMRPVKGVDVLIQALVHADGHPEIHLVLAGEVRDPRVRALAEASPYRERIHLLGYRTDAPAIMRACDLFCMPSVEREGLPRAVIEAMSQRVPPVVSDVGGMPELVEDGVSGLVVPPRDPHALGHALRVLADDGDRRRRMGDAARERINTEFHISRTLQRTEALYRSVNAAGR